jgi:hypothetical protein
MPISEAKNIIIKRSLDGHLFLKNKKKEKYNADTPDIRQTAGHEILRNAQGI